MNPSAFPTVEYNGDGFPTLTDAGMTLRDYFAAKAMASLLAGSQAKSEAHVPEMMELVSRFAYMAADAMLKAREAKQ